MGVGVRVSVWVGVHAPLLAYLLCPCRGRTYAKKLRFLRKKEQGTQI